MLLHVNVFISLYIETDQSVFFQLINTQFRLKIEVNTN